MTLQHENMDHPSRQRFPLLRRLSIVSFVAMLATASFLVFLYHENQLSEYQSTAAHENERDLLYIVRALNGEIDAYLNARAGQHIPAANGLAGFDALVTAELDKIDKNALKLKIYNMAGTAAYSSDAGEIGGGSAHPDWLARALHGETIHSIERRDTFVGLSGEVHDVDLALTYMPLSRDGRQTGVIEIYRNVTGHFAQLQRDYLKIALAVLGAFGSLFAALFYSVYKTDRDIARWQDTVAENEANLRNAQTIGRLGSYQLHVQTGLIEGSEMLDSLFGVDQDYEHTVKGWIALIHPDDRTKMVEYFQNEVVGKRKPYDREYRIIRHNDHAERWMHGLGQITEFDEQGRPLLLQGTVQDITDRKRAELELRIAAAAFDTQDAIVITDADANIVRVNQAFSEITGYRPDEVIGKNPRIMSSGRHDRSFYIEMWQQLMHAGRWSGEIFDRRKSGEIYPKWVTITAIRDAQQEISNYVAIFSDITERKRIEEEIHSLAFYDVLTKLPNRRLCLDRFHTALAASARRNDYGAVLFIDLDRFKTLNDTYGHEYGDMLLVEVGARIRSCVREMDTVSRFGGDEFVVLVEGLSTNRDDATAKVEVIAEKIRKALASPYNLKEHEHHCSPSIGITLYHGNEISPDVLVEHADMAMYQVKNSGRNGVLFFDPVMQHNVAQHQALENDLHYAIELQQLHLHYQIQVNSDNHPIGAEAFLRWEHPERGVIMPGQFLPIADESNLIIDIGHWVLGEACRQLALWSKNEKLCGLTLTINISAKHFSRPEFVDEVAAALQMHGAVPTHLKLELPERLVLNDMNSVMDKVGALKKLGVRLSMDNFGTMYSSLSYLKHLSSDQLKIHQEFVQGITQQGNDAHVVQTVIDLARSLALNVFAEGVETEEQLAFLREHDCNAYQGYLFGKPVPLEEFEALLKEM